MNNIELLNFIDLNFEEKKMILEWRNRPQIRECMYNEEEIKLEEHLNFIENLKIKKDKLYFLVKEKNAYIGVIDFVNITPISLEMGIYGNPDLFGYGKTLLNEIINYSFDTLKVKKIFSEVFVENIKAHELYKKFGFEKIGTKNINNKEVIIMELENENR